jgi:hypothetical protein
MENRKRIFVLFFWEKSGSGNFVFFKGYFKMIHSEISLMDDAYRIDNETILNVTPFKWNGHP